MLATADGLVPLLCHHHFCNSSWCGGAEAPSVAKLAGLAPAAAHGRVALYCPPPDGPEPAVAEGLPVICNQPGSGMRWLQVSQNLGLGKRGVDQIGSQDKRS